MNNTIKTLTRAVVIISLSLSQAACQYYGVNFSQGNEIKASQMHALKPGMSEADVLDMLGTPLYDNTFNKHRWIYVYTKQHRKEMSKHKLILDFENDRLVKIST